MATKIVCDICGEEVPTTEPVYTLGISQMRSGDLGGLAGGPATVAKEHVCHRCARRAVQPPARESVGSAVRGQLRGPLTSIASRHLSGTALAAEPLVDEIIVCVTANANAIAKAAK